MATNEEILIKLKALDELTPVMVKALQNMEATTARMTDSLNKMNEAQTKSTSDAEGSKTSWASLGNIMTGMKSAVDMAAQAWAKISEHYEKAIHEAVEAENVQNRLTGAMISTGQYTQELSDKVERYAAELEHLKGISGEQTKTLIAQAVQMGLTVDKALQMEAAARKLAVATGGDANSAFAMLQASLNGNNRALARVLPQVKELSEGSLRTGSAIDVVNKALEAQYKLYEGSYSAALKKSQNALSNVYEALGNIIIKNPIVIKSLQNSAEMWEAVQKKVESFGKFIEENQTTIEEWVNAFKQAIAIGAIALGVWAVAAGIASASTITLTAAIAVLASPITLAVVAAAGLVAAFKVWPDLFDKIVGSLKVMVSSFMEGLAGMANIAAKVATAVGMNGLAGSLSNVTTGLMKQSEAWGVAGAQQIEFAGTSMATAQVVVKGENEKTKAIDANAAAESKRNKALLETQQTYGDFEIGTEATRKALAGQASDLDSAFKKFEEYYTNRTKVAVSAEADQAARIAEFRAKQMTGGGPEAKIAGADKEIAAAKVALQMKRSLKAEEILDAKQYSDEVNALQDKIANQELIKANAHRQALADALGDSSAGLSTKLAIRQSQFDALLKQREDAARLEGASEGQIAAMKLQAQMKFREDSRAQAQAAVEMDIAIATEGNRRKAELLGDTPEALAAKKDAEKAEYEIKRADMEARFLTEIQDEDARKSAREELELQHKNRLSDMEVKFWEDRAAERIKAKDNEGAFHAQIQAEQEKHGKVMGMLTAVQNSSYMSATKNMFNDLVTATKGKSKTLFEIGKKAAIADTLINTYQSATKAFNAFAGLPIVGPALGYAAAAAAVAAGFANIQKIESQKFEGGGQADSGMDSIPQALDGKSFTLSAGERVVQPSANKDLTEFLNGQRTGASGNGGNTYNVSLQYSGAGGEGDARKMAEVVVQEIRRMSERGTPIMSERGLIKT